MPVVPRASDAGNGTVITSPNVAAKTVVGMVLGILCLFTMVLTYQFIACPHRKRAAAARRVPRNASQAAKTAHTPSKTARSFRSCSNLFGRSSSKPAPTNRAPGTSEKRAQPQDPKDGRRTLRALLLPFASHGTSRAPETHPSPSQPKPTLLERKGLRALRLNTELLKSDGKQRYPATPSPTTTTPARKRMGRVFEFASSPLSTPSSSSTLFSAGTPTPTSTGRRHRYKKLADDKLYSYSDWSNEAVYPTSTSRPPEALVSPWSPNERQYPYAPYSPLSVRWLSDSPRTPPPLYPPPPAYLPEVPVRSDGLGSAPATATRPSGGGGGGGGRMASPLAPPVSPIIRRLSEEVDGEIGSWESDMPDIRAALASVVTLDRRPVRAPDREAERGEEDVFVIANGSDSGDDDASSELESVSLHTATDEYESMEPLTL